MKKSGFLFIFAGILLPQLLLQTYWLIIVLWIASGLLSALFLRIKKIFWTGFIIQLIIGVVLFLVVPGNSAGYLLQIPEYFNLPGFILPLTAILFNAFNAAICLFTGAAFYRLFHREAASG